MSQQSFNTEQVVRTTQIITGAMVTGVVTFATIVVFALGALKGPSDGFLISGVGAAFAGGLCFWMLAMFPTRTKIEHWAETQQMSLGGP